MAKESQKQPLAKEFKKNFLQEMKWFTVAVVVFAVIMLVMTLKNGG